MLEDLLKPGLRVVVCGTAAGKRSAELRQYYAGRGNKFWSVLADVGLTPRVLRPNEYRELLNYDIGLTDVAKGQSGSDTDIDFKRATPEAVRQKVEALKPAVLCFNGKRGAQIFLGRNYVDFGLQNEVVGNTKLFVAPSTSGAANHTWDLEKWRELARLVGVLAT
jgi:TDG/mug DNA glycosylase family protein